MLFRICSSSRVIIILFAITLFLCHSCGFLYCSVKSKIDQGNVYYNRQRYDDALTKYREAEIEKPDLPEIHFNIGDALYKQGKYEEAMQEFQKALYSKDIPLQAKTYYNIGNCLYYLGKWEDAIQNYKKCLELTPDDEDAKYNIEFIQRRLKELIDKGLKQGTTSQMQLQQQAAGSASGKQQQQKQEQQQRQGQDKEKQKNMSKEDAERLLQMVESQEKENMKKKVIKLPSLPRPEKDW
jgi:Ca-activated chloride channel family protein